MTLPKLPRRSVLMSAIFVLPAVSLATAHAADVSQADFLFVQTAKGMTFDKASGKLTLVDVSPITVMFADRPERIAGNMKTARFVPFWSEGKDSFLKDPPNADISIVEGTSMRQVVATLEQPELKDGNLTYAVKILEGDMPESGSDVSVFIDVIGMPLRRGRLRGGEHPFGRLVVTPIVTRHSCRVGQMADILG